MKNADDVCKELVDTNASLVDYAERVGMSIDTVRGLITDAEIERCAQCGTWLHVKEFNADGECVKCAGLPIKKCPARGWGMWVGGGGIVGSFNYVGYVFEHTEEEVKKKYCSQPWHHPIPVVIMPYDEYVRAFGEIEQPILCDSPAPAERKAEG